MHETEVHPAPVSQSSRAGSKLAVWAVLSSTVLAFAVAWLFLRGVPRPSLFPPLVDPQAPTLQETLVAALLFAALAAAVSVLGALLAGRRAALAAGILLVLSWPALLFVALAPGPGVLAFLLLTITLLFLPGGRIRSGLAWIALLAVAATLIVPTMREAAAGLWRLPVPVDWPRLVFWQQGSEWLRGFPFLGAGVSIALGLSSLLVLRGRREGRVVAALLLLSLVCLFLVDRAWALLPYSVAALAALGGVWVDSVWEAIRGRRRRALAALLAPTVILLALGSLLSRVDAAQLKDAELELRLERAAVFRDQDRFFEAEDELKGPRREYPKDRRVRLATGELQLARERYDAAAGTLKRLRLDYPEWRGCLMASGWANFHTQSYHVARREFERILEKEPRNPRALIGLGASILHAENNVEEAARLMLEGLSIDDDIPEGHHYMAALLMGTTRNIFKDEEREKMIRYHATRTLQLDPGDGMMRRFVRRMGWVDLLEEYPRPLHAPLPKER